MKVAFFEVKEWEKIYLNDQFKNFQVSFFEEPLTKNNISAVKDCDIISIFIDSQITKDIIFGLEGLTMIATRSTGFDHIDLEACRQRKITVCNVPHYGDNSVAEHAFALILDLSRKIHQSIERVKNGEFSFEGLTGFDLQGKTLGVVGLGNIGRHVVRIAKGFDMKVLGYDVFLDKKLAKKLGFTYASLEELLKNSDIVTLHVPYSKHTHHLINATNLLSIKKGAYIINTSRGGIIETDALVKALLVGTLAGAGLDVLEEENFIKEEAYLLSKESSKKPDLKTLLEDHVLMEQENVIITPHNAFNTKEALEKILESTVSNIQGFIQGKVTNVI